MGRRKKRKQRLSQLIFSSIIIIGVLIFRYLNPDIQNTNNNSNILNNIPVVSKETITIDLSTIPEYSNIPYVVINNNIPNFKEEDYTLEPFENYSEWDILGRSGVAYANICKEIMPKKRRRTWRNRKY